MFPLGKNMQKGEKAGITARSELALFVWPLWSKIFENCKSAIWEMGGRGWGKKLGPTFRPHLNSFPPKQPKVISEE